MSKFIKALAAIMLTIAILNAGGCKKQEKDSVKPEVETSSISNITETSATGGGVVISDGGSSIIERGVCWSKEHNPVVSDFHVIVGGGVGSFTCSLDELEPNTTYYLRAYAINNVGITYGSEISFVTLQNSNLPTVTISQVTEINSTNFGGHGVTVYCNGTVTDEGSSGVIEFGFCWNQSSSPTIEDSFIEGWNMNMLNEFYAYITNLESNTTYYIRAYAKNNDGIGYSSELCITTLCECPPSISVLLEDGYLHDGSTLNEMNTEYRFGFYMFSNSETQQPLVSLHIMCNQYDWDWVSLDGLTEYTYIGSISFSSKSIIEESEFMAIVTDNNGKVDTASFTIGVDETLSLDNAEFEWIRQGALPGTGLEEFGLRWERNYKSIYAHIEPLEGVSLYMFDPSVWNEVNTIMSKKVLFMDAVENSYYSINEYEHVDVLSSNDYDDVIGTIMPDGTCHLLHITRCDVSNYTRFTISGEAK